MRLKLLLIHPIHLKPPWLLLPPKREKDHLSKATFHSEQYYNASSKAANMRTAEHNISEHSEGPDRLWCLPCCKKNVEEGASGDCLIHSLFLSHVQILLDFIFKTTDSLSHLLCRGTHVQGWEEGAKHMADLINVKHLVAYLPADSLGLVDPADLLCCWDLQAFPN